MKRARRDPFADEPTRVCDAANIPLPVDDDETTRPVAVEELELTARRSVEVVEPHDPTSLPAVRTSTHARPRPFVELVVAGAGAVVTLPVHRLLATGVVLLVPPGVPLELAADTPVTAVIHLVRDDEVTRARLPAHVAHHRSASTDVAGGVSLRWDLRDPGARRAVEALVASAVTP